MLAACFSLCFVFAACLADEPSLFQSDQYNDGQLGQYVTQSFKSSNVIAPRLNVYKPFTECDDGSYIFISPRGEIAESTPYILDHNGSLVWAPDRHYGEVYNFQVQNFRGAPYLTFWAGDDSVGGHGVGKYYMLDQHYEEYRIILGGKGLGADLHAFTLTDEGTALFTAYEKVETEVRSIGRRPGKGYIWDSLFQEIDVETREVKFQWRASDHISSAETFARLNMATNDDPWDFFHINMVEKDPKGNYLVSSRYLRGVIYISGETGEVLWQLGGKKNSFRDLSGGEATTFVGQHDAHFTDNYTAVTLFDNRGDWFYHIDHDSRGTKIKLDFEEMTATREMSYLHPQHILSVSQGSYQTLPNGHVLLGYGMNGALTEFSQDGEVLCDALFEPLNRFGSGDVQSYRNLKFNWTGMPNTKPRLAVEDGRMFVSWKGTTETRSWRLQHSNASNQEFLDLGKVEKTGFETTVDLQQFQPVRRHVRVLALDKNGIELAISNTEDLGGELNEWTHGDHVTWDEQHGNSQEAPHQDTPEGEHPHLVPGSEHGGQHEQQHESANEHKDGEKDGKQDGKPDGQGSGEEEHENEQENLHQDPQPQDDSQQLEDQNQDTGYQPPAVHEDLHEDMDDLQLLLIFGILAVLSAGLVAWLTFGRSRGDSSPPSSPRRGTAGGRGVIAGFASLLGKKGGAGRFDDDTGQSLLREERGDYAFGDEEEVKRKFSLASR